MSGQLTFDRADVIRMMKSDMDGFSIPGSISGDEPAIRNVVFSVFGEYGLRPDPASTASDLEDVSSSYTERESFFPHSPVAQQWRVAYKRQP